MKCYITNLDPGLWMVVCDPVTGRNFAVQVDVIDAAPPVAVEPGDENTAIVELGNHAILAPYYDPQTSYLSGGEDKALIRGGQPTARWHAAMGRKPAD